MINVSGRDPVIVRVPIFAASGVINQDALIMAGPTQATNQGLAILATGAGTDAIGILRGKYTYSTTNTSNQTGTQWVLVEVELSDVYNYIEVEYDQTDTMAVASTSGTTVTVTSLENNIDCSWLYAVSGTGAGKLAFITASASGSCTTKTATGWDSTTVLIKIFRFGHTLAKLNTTADKIGTDAAVGTWKVAIMESWFEAAGFTKQQLNPTIHDNLTLTNPRFTARLIIRNGIGNTSA